VGPLAVEWQDVGDMSFVKFVMISGLTVGAVQLWKHHEHARYESAMLASADTSGFVEVLMPNGAQPDTVLILAARNCPSAAARRADDLARQLTAMGVPNVRSDQVSFTFDRRNQDQIDRLNRGAVVGKGEIPAVFINGMGKANPTTDEVVAEYRHLRSSL
jgi:hypothetical protein